MFTYCDISSLISYAVIIHLFFIILIILWYKLMYYFSVHCPNCEKTSLVYLILININLEVSISDVIYICIYHNLVTEMQAAVAIISVSRSIHHKLSFHCHVMIYFQNISCMYVYISKIKVFVFVFVCGTIRLLYKVSKMF